MDFDARFRIDSPPVEEFEAEGEKPLVSSKLRIKLKVTNREIVHGDDDKDDDRGASRSNEGVWICRLCGKEFESGKALGGHMRVHKQPALTAGAGASSRKTYLQDLERDGQPTCSLCNKTFSSRNSLYGHMRCHPERDYRGMNPPETSAAESGGGATTPSSTIDSDHPAQETEYCSSPGVDLLRYLDDWPVVKKTRSGGALAAADVAPTLDDDEIGAVQGMMLLATGGNRYRLIDRDDNVDEIRDAKKLKLSSEKSISSCKNTTAEIEDSDNSKIQLDYEDKINTNSAMKKRKRGVKAVKTKELEDPLSNYQITNPDPVDAAPKCYSCRICNKTFATPQALGGHKSSAHNKLLIKPTTSPAADSVLLLEYGGLGGVLKPHICDGDQEEVHHMITNVVVPPVTHICKTCDKAFPTGQALGGHMRRHWQGPPPAAGLVLQQMLVMNSDQSGLSTTKEPVLGFDLNELPEVDDSEVQWRIR